MELMKDKELLKDKTAKSLHICKQNENPNKHLVFFVLNVVKGQIVIPSDDCR